MSVVSSELEQIGILVVEDHQLLRTGLKLTLSQCPRFRIVGEAPDGLTAVDMAIKLRPHVILMDVALPNIDGFEATKQIKQAHPSVRVLMLTSHDSDDDIIQAFGVGADGYCCKDISLEQLTEAIDTVMSGASWLDPQVKFRTFDQDAIEKSAAQATEPKWTKTSAAPQSSTGGRINKVQQLFTQLSDVLVQNSVDGIIVFDAHNRVIVWNDAMERIFGIPCSEAIGKAAADILSRFKDSEDDKFLAAAMNGKAAVGTERKYCHTDAKYTTYYEARYDTVGNTGAVATFRDVTEQKLLGKEAETGFAFIATLADSNPNLVWICGPDGERNFFNRSWQRFTGRTLDQESGQKWMESMHPHQIAGVRKKLIKALKSGKNYRIEYQLKARDGRYHSILESASAHTAADGTFLGFVGWCTDISETRMTKSEIPSLHTRLYDLSPTNTQSPIGMWKLDNHLIITKANPAASEQLGIGHNDLVGRTFAEFVPALSGDALCEVLIDGKRFRLRNQEVLTQRNDERLAFWDIEAWPLKDETGNVIGIAVSTQEVTDRQRIEQQKEDFVATLVHDLKTPLIGADRTLQALMNGAAGNIDRGQSEILNLLKTSNRQLLAMVQNLIEVYRFEEGKPRFSCELASLEEIVDNAAEELSILAEHKGVCLSQSLPTTLSRVVIDRMAMRRVFQNLLDNAIKFTAKDGVVKVSAEEDADSVTVHVRDSGIGIPLEEQPNVFKKFSQGINGRIRAAGSGLGLYLCKQIVEAHNGTLTFSSIEGEGTTFTVKLPKDAPIAQP